MAELGVYPLLTSLVLLQGVWGIKMWCNFYIPALNSAPYYHLLFPDYNKLCLVPFRTLLHKFSAALNPRSAFPVTRFLHVPFKHVFKAISSVPRFKQSVDFTILNTAENLRNACCYPPLNRNLCRNNGQLDGLGGLVVSILASGTQVCGFKPGRSRWIFRA